MSDSDPERGIHQDIAADVKLGRDVRLSSFLNLYGCTIGDDTTIGAFVEIQRGVSIGSRCKVSSHSFVCEGVVIEDECFIGHGVTFINDRYPRATNPDGSLQTSDDWELVPTRVRRRASIGSNATILAGVEIGEGALVAAGAVVTRNVAPNTVVMGSPARPSGVVPEVSRIEAPTRPTDEEPPRVRFLDLKAQHQPLRHELLAAWERILDTTAFVSGAEVRAFEEEFAAACGVQHCVAVSNGTDALILALQALGVGAGDEVAVPANSFIATAAAVTLVGARPVFVDCEAASANVDVQQAESALAAGARGVIPVHLYGLPADVDPLCAAALEAGAFVLEDAAQAHLAGYRGATVGSLGHVAAFSFYPGKNLGAPGEGGAVTTNDGAVADRLRALRDHGQLEKYHSTVVGRNARMTELTAATLRIKLRHLPTWNDARRRFAARYRQRLAEVPEVVVQAEPAWARSVYHLFVAQVPDRDRVRAELDAAGIETGLHYPVPIHLQPAYAGHKHQPGDFPNAERWAERGISLPMYAELSDADVDRVCEALIQAVAGRSPE